ncbi:Hypothetical predicted protein [Paramuricea clavata]|uniref:Uncharacterized protein n=1 Tax=Paramuricea clavata TaxID=317549 RepID=A0A6S7HTQ6_PARCT|nr:Hypothetical predicted protein [Paramuricea clavata]
MSSPNFTAADFAKWNQTSSCFRIPKRLIAKDSVSQVRVALIQAIGSAKVSAVQALPDNKYRLEFTSQQHKTFFEIHGLDFRGVHITPTPAYEQFIRVIVDRAPIHMPDAYITSSLEPFGRVVSVQHLTVRGFPKIRTGTRMVSMSLLKPIPPELTIANFKCSIKYRGQPKFCFGCRSFGHFVRLCPQSLLGTQARRTMAEVASTNSNPDPPQVPVQPSSVTAAVSASSPVNVGATTSRDYVSPSSAPPRPTVAMDVSSSEESVHVTAAPSSTSQDTPIGLSIHLSDFKDSVAFSGDFSYSRRVSSFKRVAKTRSPDRATARKVIRSRRLDEFAIRRNQDGVSVVAATSVSVAVVSTQQQPVASPAVVTSNRYSVLEDEAAEPAAFEEPVPSTAAPVESPLAQAASPSVVTPTRPVTSDAPADLAALGESVVDPLASPLSAPRTPSAVLPVESLPEESSPVAVMRTPPADVPPSDSAASECSIGEFSSPPSATRAPASCGAIVPYVPSMPGPDASLVAHLPAVPASPLLSCSLPSLQLDSPSWFSSNLSDGHLTTPSFNPGSVRSPASSEESFYTLSLEPSFQSGGSDHYFSDGDPSPPAFTGVSIEQSGVLAIQDADQAPGSPSLTQQNVQFN